jgi:hypothetical protein
VAPRIQRLSGFENPLTEEAALLERAGVRIVGRAVKVMAGEFSIRIPFKRGRGIERRRDCAGGRVHMSSGVNAGGLKLLVRIRGRVHFLSVVPGARSIGSIRELQHIQLLASCRYQKGL